MSTHRDLAASFHEDDLRRPFGFDMEWVVIYRPMPITRRTAVLQVSNAKMILVIHLSAMNGELTHDAHRLSADFDVM